MGLEKRQKESATKSQRKTGGQIDHPGSTLEWSLEVDVVVEHKVDRCYGCGTSLTQEPVKTVWARQVHDIPPIDSSIYEHRAEVKRVRQFMMAGKAIRATIANISSVMPIIYEN